MKTLTVLFIIALSLFNPSRGTMAATDEIATFDMGQIRPEGTAYDLNITADGKILVADLTNKNIFVLDKDLKEVRRLTEVLSPHGISADQEGSIYVGTHRSGRVTKFDPQYQEIKDWDASLVSEKRMTAPVTVCTETDGSVYVADWVEGKVFKVSKDGKFLLAFEDAAIKQKGEFKPHGISTDGQTVYVADLGVGAIQTFTTDGKYLGAWEKPAADFFPFAVRLLTKDMVMAPSENSGAIHVFDKKGRHLKRIESRGDQPGQFAKAATSLVADPEGFVYATELGGNRVRKLDFRPVIKECETLLTPSPDGTK